MKIIDEETDEGYFIRYTGGGAMRLLCISLSCLFLAGCSQTLHVSATNLASNVRSMEPEELEYYEEADLAPLNVQIIGHVFVEKTGTGLGGAPNRAKLESILRDQASSLGAEGIIGVRYSHYAGSNPHKLTLWGSGLAVTFLSEEKSPEPVDFTVMIFPPLLDDSIGSDSQKRFTTAMMKTAQYELDKRGYYSVVTGYKLDAASFDSLGVVPYRELADVEPALVLMASFEEYGDKDIGILASSASGLRMKLLSKDSGTTIWRDQGSASMTVGWLRALADDYKVESVYGAVESVFRSLGSRH